MVRDKFQAEKKRTERSAKKRVQSLIQRAREAADRLKQEDAMAEESFREHRRELLVSGAASGTASGHESGACSAGKCEEKTHSGSGDASPSPSPSGSSGSLFLEDDDEEEAACDTGNNGSGCGGNEGGGGVERKTGRARPVPRAQERRTAEAPPSRASRAVKKRPNVPVTRRKPIGFEDLDAVLQSRLDRDPSEKFQVERVVNTTKTRYIPFGYGSGNNDTRTFYLEPTDLCCMWCTEPIGGLPVPLPMKWSESLKTFEVFGQFCSFNCMLSGAKQRGVKQSLARFLMSRVYNISMRERIEPAMSPFALQKFGGLLTTEAFRATSRLGIRHKELAQPLVPYNAGIEEVEKMVLVVRETCEGGEVIHRIQQAMNTRRGLQPIENTPRERMQRGKFTAAPSIQEQILNSSQRLRLQMQETGLDKVRKRRRTLMDYINKRAGSAEADAKATSGKDSSARGPSEARKRKRAPEREKK